MTLSEQPGPDDPLYEPGPADRYITSGRTVEPPTIAAARRRIADLTRETVDLGPGELERLIRGVRDC